MFLSNRNGKWEFFVSDANGANVRQVLKNVTDLVSIKFDYENERVMDWTKKRDKNWERQFVSPN